MKLFRSTFVLFFILSLLLPLPSIQKVVRRLPTEANWVNVVDSGFGFPELSFYFSVESDLFDNYYLALFFPFNIGEKIQAYVGEVTDSCSKDALMTPTTFQRNQVSQDNYFIYLMKDSLQTQKNMKVTLQTTSWANDDGLYNPIQMHAVSSTSSFCFA